MKETKPEWYTRLKKGPFEETVFDSKMRQKVEERARSEVAKTSKRRLNTWTAVGVMAMVLICVIVLYSPLSDQFRASGTNGSGQPGMTEEFVREHLKIGQTEEEVKRSFGNAFQGQSVRRDFPQPHHEDQNDMRTWSAVDSWRYDYGVRNGYQVQSDLEQDEGFDMVGLRNGSIESQLVVVWKEGKVERALYAYGEPEKRVTKIQIGPAMEDYPSKQPPETTENISDHQTLKVRAVGESTFGRFELRPKKGTKENIQPLGAPSCLGLETDLKITGNYELYFKPNSGKEQVIYFMDGVEIIQKENKAIRLQRLDFPDVELFLFMPRYTDCHGLEFRVYGVNKKSGEASPFQFVQEHDGTVHYWTTSPVNLPTQVDSRLVVEGGRAAGTDGATRYYFKPDVVRHQLYMEYKEQIP